MDDPIIISKSHESQKANLQLEKELSDLKLVEQLHNVNRKLHALSNCNQTLLRATDEQTLLNEICRIICDDAGYRLAWVGYAENDADKTIRPVAWSGFDNGYIANIKLTWSENSEYGKGPAGKAIRSGQILYVQDFTTDPQMSPWCQSALQRGYRAGIALPLKDENGKVFGVLLIYSSESNSITMDEIKLMEELASDLAFGIIALRIRYERKRVEDDLKKSNDMLRAIIEAAPTAIMGLDLEGYVHTVWNPAAEKLLGWNAQEAIGHFLPSVPQDKKEEFKKFRDWIRSGKTMDGVDVKRQKRDGTPIEYSIYASPLHDLDGKITGNVAVLMDITERKKAEQERLAHLRFFESMDQINKAIQETNDLEQMLKGVLNTMLSIFDCNRVLLFSPCDPDAASFRVMMESFRIESAFPVGFEIQMDTNISQYFQAMRDINNIKIFDSQSNYPLSEALQYVKPYFWISTALYPQVDKPWLLELHYDSSYQVWTQEDKRLFQEITRKLHDALANFLILRDLKESEEKYRTLVQKIQAGVIVHSSNTEILTCNPAAERLLGLTKEQLIGKTVLNIAWNFFCEDGSNMPAEEYPVNQVLTQQQSLKNFIIGVRHIEKDKHFWTLVNADPVFDKEGKIAQIIVTFIDITKHKQAEKALEESEAKMRSILENIEIGISLISPKMEILELNNRMHKWFPIIEPDQHPICYHAFNNPPREKVCEYCPVIKTLEDKQVHEATSQTPQAGTIRNYRIVSSPILNSSGEITAVIEIVEDITKKLSLEAQFLQAQKMESIGSLAGGIAHDFNNMLGVILGHVDMAMEQMYPLQPFYTDMQEIRKAATRSANLTRQLLAFARQQPIMPKVLDLNETIEGMLKMLRRLIGENIHLDWQPGLKTGTVNMDPSQIDQILANLCVNARDAIIGVGKITIKTGIATFDNIYCTHHPGFIPGEFVFLEVIDNGCGMSKEILDRLFEPFFTTKEIGKGTGLGLATVYGIVKQNNGFIKVYSEPGCGATFSIYLPRYSAKADPTPKINFMVTNNQGNETLLLVEDEPAILDMVKIMLERLGYRVLPASTPGEAIRIASEHHEEIQLLITDVVMPDMNGWDLSKKITSFCPEMKKIFMSGYSSNTIASRCLLDKDINFIQKPFLLHDLAQKVRESLDKKVEKK